MMVTRWIGGVALAVAISTGVAAADRPRAVLELYTSQGCSSCPPADTYLSEIADRTDVIALTFAVDYWDYLGWKDTLADPANGKRQKAYAAVRGDRQVYTPQMVVNGGAHVVGSDRQGIERAVSSSNGQHGAMTLPVTIEVKGDTVTIQLPAAANGIATADTPAQVFLLGVVNRAPVTISRGENRGHTMVYRNVVRSMTPVGEWTGTAQSFTISRRDRIAAGCERAVVLVQAGTARRPATVLGAAVAGLQ